MIIWNIYFPGTLSWTWTIFMIIWNIYFPGTFSWTWTIYMIIWNTPSPKWRHHPSLLKVIQISIIFQIKYFWFTVPFTLIKFDKLKELYRKNETWYRLKPENLRCWSRPIRHLSDVPVDLGILKYNCVKFMRKFINMQFCIKVLVLNRSYSTNTQSIWKWRYPTEAWESHVWSYFIFFCLFCIFNRYNW